MAVRWSREGVNVLEVGLVSIGSITDRILSLPVWFALALVFLLPALEASAFLGFIFPGEIAVILGGVVASQGRAPLWAFIIALSGHYAPDSLRLAHEAGCDRFLVKPCPLDVLVETIEHFLGSLRQSAAAS